MRSPTDVELERSPMLETARTLLPDWDDEWLVIERERLFAELGDRKLTGTVVALAGLAAFALIRRERQGKGGR